MKLVTFASPSGGTKLGALSTDAQSVVDLQEAQRQLSGTARAELADMLTLLDAGPAGMDLARETLALALSRGLDRAVLPLPSVRLLSPLPRPRSIRDCMAFEQHVLQATQAVVQQRSPAVGALNRLVRRLRGRPLVGVPAVWYERPIYYKSNCFAVSGPEDEIHWPSGCSQLDYELELGIVIGRRGRDIPEGQAAQHIAGYTVFNDFSARDIQFREMQGRLGPAKSKDFDTANAVGPYLVTADELPDPHNLLMQARINGETWSRGNVSQMHWSFEQIISYISRDETLHPGEFIGSGTVGGGCGLELGRCLAPGDLVELEIEHLGVLRNRVGRPPT